MSENEGQTKKTWKERHPYKNPFCVDPGRVQHPALDYRFGFEVVSAKVKDGTLTTEPVFEKFDQQERIQACKELCGMEYMKMLLATGQASAEDFYDDGNGGVDTTALPKTVHEAKAKADEYNAKIQEVAESLDMKEGEKLNQDQLIQLYESRIKELLAAKQASAQANAQANAQGGNE